MKIYYNKILMIKISGYNQYSQLGVKNNYKLIRSNISVDPPFESRIDPKSIFCFSVLYQHSVLITKQNVLQATGNNEDGRIIGSLPRKTIKLFTKFEILFQLHVDLCILFTWY